MCKQEHRSSQSKSSLLDAKRQGHAWDALVAVRCPEQSLQPWYSWVQHSNVNSQRSFLTSDTKVRHWSFFIITKNSKEQIMVLQERFFSESAPFWGWVRLSNLTLRAKFRKTRKVEDVVPKICARKKKKMGLTGCSTCKERSNRKGRRGKENRKSPSEKKWDWLPWTNETKIRKITRCVS